MEHRKTSELDEAVALDGSEIIHIVQHGRNVRATVGEIVTAATPYIEPVVIPKPTIPWAAIIGVSAFVTSLSNWLFWALGHAH